MASNSQNDVGNYALSVIAPCYNEEDNITPFVERTLKVFEKMGIVAELILVDDGSTDLTRLRIEENVSRYPDRIKGVFQQKNHGLAYAWKSGLAAVRSEIVCLIDSDMQYLPEDISRLHRHYVRFGVDIVQGVRTTIDREKSVRYFLSKGLNHLLNFCFRMHSTDSKSGFIITRKDVLADILHYSLSYAFFQTFIMVAAHAKGYSCAEVEVLFDRRYAGSSFLTRFPIRTSLISLVDIAKALYEYRLSNQYTSFLDRFLSQYPVKDRGASWSLLRRWYFRFYLLLMPMHHWLISRRVGQYFFALRSTQWLRPEEIQKLQLARLRSLLEHSYRHVSYWRELFDEIGFVPDGIKSLDDLQRLPFLEKQTVRERIYFDLMSDNHRKKDIWRISTSGSTGQPLICYADRTQLEIRWASTLRSQEWVGYRFGDRCVRLWHQTIGMNRSQIFRERIDAMLSRRTFIPAYRIDDNNIRDFLKIIKKSDPKLIDGYAESFNFLSIYLKEFSMDTARPLGIISSAQMLSKQSRATIERAFGCKVYDKYGSREFSGIAYECEYGEGHHVVAESYIVEIIKDGRPAKPGETGEVVITDLNNYVMPMIRYRLGDLAVATDRICSCGRGLPLIGDIEGRTQSIIIGMSGQYVPGSFFLHFLKDYDFAIKQFQIEQREYGCLILRIVKTNRFGQGVLDIILDTFQKYVGPDMKFDVTFPDEIPLSPTGKIQVCISRLQFDFQQESKAGSDNT